MRSINLKTLTILIIIVGGLSWLGSASGIIGFLGGIDGKVPLATLVMAALGSVLIQSLMAVFLNVSMTAHVIRLRTRLMYLLGAGTMLALSSVLAIAFWVGRGELHADQSADIFSANKNDHVAVARDVQEDIGKLITSIDRAQGIAKTNAAAEDETGRGQRYVFWTRIAGALEIAGEDLKAVEFGLRAGIDSAGVAETEDELVAALSSGIVLAARQSATDALAASIEEERVSEASLAQSAEHRVRWAAFAPVLNALARDLDSYESPALPPLQEDRFDGAHGTKIYALELVQKIITGQSLDGDERLAVFLAVLTDLVFITLIVLRYEHNRPDAEAELEELYGAEVEALKSRLVRNGLEFGIGGVVGTLQTHGTGLFGFDRVFGLVVRLPDTSSKSTLAQVVSFLKADGTAYDVSAIAKLVGSSDLSKASSRIKSKDRTTTPSVTILVPAASWRLLNRFKTVEDAQPLPESNGTLADFVAQQRRRRPRVFTKTLIATLDRYFSSAMEAAVDDLIPTRIERILDAYRTDPRVKRLKRATREKHEAAFRDVIDALRNEGLLPKGGLRVAV